MSHSKPQPANILRGHKSQIHAAEFIRRNRLLATGDAEGYTVIWDLATMRPTAAWRAHKSSILGIREWGDDKIITHGRDHHLIVWKLTLEDESKLSSVPPLELSGEDPPQPWIAHLLEVNTMNFCAFAACPSAGSGNEGSMALIGAADILVAVPNTLSSEAIDIFELPSQHRVHTVKPEGNNGMAMCLSIFYKDVTLLVAAAFENGSLSVYQLGKDAQQWTSVYRSEAHAQPVLSIGTGPLRDYLLTSAADATIAKHYFTSGPSSIKTVNTKHAGQQSLKIRSDGTIFATAGWDSHARVYSTKTLKELAVLQWHQTGVYAVAFAVIEGPEGVSDQDSAVSEKDQVSNSPRPAVGESSLSERRSTAVAERRLRQARTTHWIAAGAKDGKVSLWNIY